LPLASSTRLRAKIDQLEGSPNSVNFNAIFLFFYLAIIPVAH
jgi:hypothetical protein